MESLAFLCHVWYYYIRLFIKNEGESQLEELIPTCAKQGGNADSDKKAGRSFTRPSFEGLFSAQFQP